MSETPSAGQEPVSNNSVSEDITVAEDLDRKGAIRVGDSHTSASSEERRTGPSDRRIAGEDRRNEDRVNDELLPRRNPDVTDRRAS